MMMGLASILSQGKGVLQCDIRFLHQHETIELVRCTILVKLPQWPLQQSLMEQCSNVVILLKVYHHKYEYMNRSVYLQYNNSNLVSLPSEQLSYCL